MSRLNQVPAATAQACEALKQLLIGTGDPAGVIKRLAYESTLRGDAAVSDGPTDTLIQEMVLAIGIGLVSSALLECGAVTLGPEGLQ